MSNLDFNKVKKELECSSGDPYLAKAKEIFGGYIKRVERRDDKVIMVDLDDRPNHIITYGSNLLNPAIEAGLFPVGFDHQKYSHQYRLWLEHQ